MPATKNVPTIKLTVRSIKSNNGSGRIVHETDITKGAALTILDLSGGDCIAGMQLIKTGKEVGFKKGNRSYSLAPIVTAN